MLSFANHAGRRFEGRHPVGHVFFIRALKAAIIMLRKACFGFLSLSCL